jgi:outer membrane protein insertion porin family
VSAIAATGFLYLFLTCLGAGCGVEVPKKLDHMRISSALAAIVATAATLSSATVAQGQTSKTSVILSSNRFLSLQLAQAGASPIPDVSPTPLPSPTPTPTSPTTPEVPTLQQTPPSTPSSVEPVTPVFEPPSGTSPTPQLQFPLPGSGKPAQPELTVPGSPLPQSSPTEVEQPPGTAPQQLPQPGAPVGSPEAAPTIPPSPGAETTPDSAPQPSETPAPEEAAPQPEEPRVLVAEVLVEGVDEALQDIVYNAISTRPGRTATRSQLQADLNAIFATGVFAKARVDPVDTPLGVQVKFVVQANPQLKQVQTSGTKVLPTDVVTKIFSPQYGKILNFNEVQAGIKELNKWYQDNGYVLAQVVGAPQVAEDGVVTLDIAEGVIENIQVRYVSKEGEETDEKGRAVKGRTKPYIVTREVELKAGDVFNRNTMQNDLQRVFGLGIFEDVKVALNPGEDPRRVVVTLNVAERSTRSFVAGAGISSSSGLFGSASLQFQNFRGRNQRLGTEVQISERDTLFDVSFTDPWIKGDPYRTSYTANIFRRQSISLVYNGDDTNIRLPNDDRPRVDRLGTSLTFTRPLSRNVFKRSTWTASLGAQYQRVTIRDSDGEVSARSDTGELLSFSDDGRDDLFTAQFGLVRDRRDNAQVTTKGSLFRIGTEQSVPIGSGSILFNRVRTSYSYFVPVRLLKTKQPGQSIAFNVQAGGIFGDLPPYEAFALGGSNSIRGYPEGELGVGRYFVQGSVEYRFPIFRIVGGALFFDAGSVLGSQGNVPGSPGDERGLPGSGFGGGLGVRVNSPLGPIRVDYGINDSGDGQLHFGIGQRF